MKRILRVLTPAATPRERLRLCLGVALIVHGIAVFGVGFTPVLPASATTIEWVASGSGPSGEEWGAGEGVAVAPAWVRPVLGAGADSPQHEAEQDYVRRWIAHTERLGAPIAEGLYGEIVAHVNVASDGRIRAIEIAPGPDHLRHAVRDIVRRAQPHPSFPDALRAYQDSVRISRLWKFGDNTDEHREFLP